MTQFMQISSSPAAPTTYMALSAVLAFLVFLTIWREASSSGFSSFFSRTFSAVAFLGSRIVAIIFSGALVASSSAPPVLYMALNFICLYLAVGFISDKYDLEVSSQDDVAAAADDTELEANRRSEKRALKFQTVIFALLGAAVYLILPKQQALVSSFGAVTASMLFGATVRVLAHLIQSARRNTSDFAVVTQALFVFLAASWLSVILASLTTGKIALLLLLVSRASDICALVSGLVAIQSNFLTIGFYHKSRADSIHEEAEKAKAELNLISRVASDIYEDSNTMIQRQQDQSRNLMRRVESLEKILQIGITIQKHNNLKDLLQMIAELTKDNLGFNTVILRLLNQRTQSFETKAYVGLSEEAEDAVVNYRLPVAEYEQLVDPRFRISRSYYIKISAPLDENKTETNEEVVLMENHWAEIDRLIIPLLDERENAVGYISVEDPYHTDVSVVEAIDNLETVATLAVLAIRNTRFVKDIGEKNEKLNLYAEKLAGLNQMKSNFVATISHEFRTPLTSIKAYCETLLSNADNVDRNILKEFLVVIDEESDRLMSLIEDILDFSQMESGAAKVERTSCNVGEVVAVAAAELAKNFKRKNITLYQEIPESEVTIRAERELMRQLMINLLHNASKFTQENGQVRITIEEEAVSVRITVEDNGIGIPEDQIEMIFERFHQADNTATRKYGGSGLGLAICKNIVDWHDGKIWVENNPGQGTKFVVVLPKKQAVVRSGALAPYGTVRRYEVERYLELVVEMIAELMNVNKASVMRLDETGGELRIESAIGMDEEIVEHARVKLGEGISGKVAFENRSCLVKDIDEDVRVNAKNNDFLYDSRSFLSVPIQRDGGVVGVINVSNPKNKETFDHDDRKLLEFFAIRVGLAFEKLIEFTTVSLDFEDVRSTFRSMLDSRRYFSDPNSDALNRVMVEVAQQLGLKEEENATLQYAFNVYDLGLAKIGQNFAKQTKPLTSEDRNNVENHTIIGTEMIKPIEVASDVRNAILYHHENFDGTGYPGKLSGEEIPIFARVIRVADSFRALISHRPYQKRYTIEEAFDVLSHRSGTFFDPAIVEIFIDAVRKSIDGFGSPTTALHIPRNETVGVAEHHDHTANSEGGL